MPKSARSAQKKAARRQLAEREAAMRALRDSASEVPDHLDTLGPFRKFTKNDLDLDLTYVWTENLSPQLKDWIFTLLHDNMREIYDSDKEWKWHDATKREQVFDTDTRYVIATDAATQAPMAFVQLQFLIEEEINVPVLYVLEVQLSPHFQRKGLGRWLMSLAECIAIRCKMSYTVLTVLKCNTDAVKFYHKLKYELAPHSPPDEDERAHVIMCKLLNPALREDS